MLLKYRVQEQTISALPTQSIPRIGSAEYLSLGFTFSKDWVDLRKVIYFQSGDVSVPVEVPEDNIVLVPEYFTEQTEFNFTMLGARGDVEVPTNTVTVDLPESNKLWTKDAPVPQPSWLLQLQELVEQAKELLGQGMGPLVKATSSNGSQYNATVKSVDKLYVGLPITIIPNRDSSSTGATFKLNNFAPKRIVVLTGRTGTSYYPASETFLAAGKPVNLMYDGEFWVATNIIRPVAQALSGVLDIAHGGHGASTVAGARANLSVYSKAEVDALLKKVAK